MMQDLFQYGIDEKGRMRSEKTHKFKVSSLGKIPQEWEVGSITSFVNNSNPNAIKPGPFGSSIKKEIYTQKGYKVYGQEQVISGNPHFGNYYVDRKKFKELEAFKIEPGDILLSLVGTIGNVLILPSDCEAGIINPRLLKITPDKNKCETRFLAHSLLHSNTNIQLNRMATGGTMPVLNKGIVTSIEFVVPPVAEQHIIANTISALDKKIEFEAKELNKLVSLKRGLMTDLLTGAVRTIEK
jgi:type I restriction enzyme S subunit